MQKHKRWSEADLQFIKGNYGKMLSTEIARKLGRTSRSVYCQALMMKLFTPQSKYQQTGVHYTKALPEHEWPRARAFLALLIRAKRHAVMTGQKPRIDFVKMRGAMI